MLWETLLYHVSTFPLGTYIYNVKMNASALSKWHICVNVQFKMSPSFWHWSSSLWVRCYYRGEILRWLQLYLCIFNEDINNFSFSNQINFKPENKFGCLLPSIKQSLTSNHIYELWFSKHLKILLFMLELWNLKGL